MGPKTLDRVPGRVRALDPAKQAREGEYVLYWMTSARRSAYNFALDHAIDQARERGQALVVLEALRAGYRWASERFHRFVLEGMADQARDFEPAPVHYYPYLERKAGEGSGLLEALAERASLVITDEFPCYFLPRMQAAAGERLGQRMDVVDSNGLLPLSSSGRTFTTAYSFRGFLQKNLAPHLEEPPARAPLEGLELPSLPQGALAEIEGRWAPLTEEQLEAPGAFLETCDVDDSVPAVPERGGRTRGRAELERFLTQRLGRYHEQRNDPTDDVASGLSPYLHFGHLSVHEIFEQLVEGRDWSPAQLDPKGNRGKREGWWQLPPATEAFLDELVTWRELGYVFGYHNPETYDRFDSLPDFARKTLEEHAGDDRPYVYSLEEFEGAATHDELWNAAQRQLVREGKIHNYLRMLWGKKILHWSATPQDALATMIELNNKYALDGRNPNSYSGIFWVLGRFDRAWGPERPIFGKVRYMTSDSTARKFKVKPYLERYSPQAALF